MARRKRKTPRNVSLKTREMIHEGYDPKVAYAAAHDMKRRHRLGPHGEYRRRTNRKPGPRGRQRRRAA